MSYIHKLSSGSIVGIKTVEWGHYLIIKDGFAVESCDTYEQAQHIIDRMI